MPIPAKTPKTDDFRIERHGDRLVLTFTPDGRTYTFPVDGGRLTEPSAPPPRTDAGDYAEDEVRRTATELAKLALSGTSGGEDTGSRRS